MRTEEARLRVRASLLAGRSNGRSAGWRLLSLVPGRTSREDLIPASVHTGPWPDFEAPLPGAPDEYAFALRGSCLIEPRDGWTLSRPASWVPESLPHYQWTRLAPNLLSPPALSTALARTPDRHFASVISLRAAWDDNYFHFYNDVLGRLRLIESLGIPKTVPFVVSRRLYDRAYFRTCMEYGVFGGRPVVAQEPGELLSADEVIICKQAGGDWRDWDYFLDTILPDRPEPGPGRKIFLQRSLARGRTLENGDVLASSLESLGFESIDTDRMSLAEQIQLFRQTSFVVGVHSAGLTNVMFRRGAPLALLEIMPPGPVPIGWNVLDGRKTDFAYVSEQLGFSYRSVACPRPESYFDRAQNFKVDVPSVLRAVNELTPTCTTSSLREAAISPV